jgi:hypothetical protein
MSFEFYALPNEELQWLAGVLTQKNIWCWVYWHPAEGGKGYEPIKTADDLKKLSFNTKYEGGLKFFLGRTDLTNIVWRETLGGKKEIDFIKSQAIEFWPSLIVMDNILLEGRLAIMPPSEYTLQGIDPKPILRWYKEVRKSLTSMMSKEYIVVQRTTNGKLKEWREIGLTPGAISWRLSGRLLKQFPRGEVEFDVMANV